MNLRKLIFWGHVAIGLATGLIILSMSVTGLLLSFEHQITSWSEQSLQFVSPTDRSVAQAISPEALLRHFKQKYPELHPTEITLFANPAASALFSTGKQSRHYLNPYSGEIIGEGSTRILKFFSFITEWHRWLTFKRDWKNTGKAITGAGTFALLILLFSGILLWIPRRINAVSLKAISWPNFRLNGKPCHWNLHHVFGFWGTPLLLVATLTGLVMSHTWANNLLYKASATEVPAARKNEAVPRKETPLSVDFPNLNTHWNTAISLVPNWKSIRLRLPQFEKEPLNFTVDTGDCTSPNTRSQLRIESTTGKILRHESYEDLTRGKQWRLWVRAIHVGDFGGIWGHFAAAAGALAGIVLVWTGTALSFYRFGLLKKTTREKASPDTI